jgi:hypothetical protein
LNAEVAKDEDFGKRPTIGFTGGTKWLTNTSSTNKAWIM